MILNWLLAGKILVNGKAANVKGETANGNTRQDHLGLLIIQNKMAK
jgi:hypothetical protein